MLDPSLESPSFMLAIAGLVLAAAAIGTKLSSRAGIPTALIFIGLGMVLGWHRADEPTLLPYGQVYLVGNVALALILFCGGLSTDLRRTRGVWGPSVALATVGVLGVSMLIAAAAWMIIPGFQWERALVLGAVLGSTDAASVLQILGGERLAGRIRETVELESGLNDPMAFVLVAAFTGMAMGKGWSWWAVPEIAWQLAAGALIGAAIGKVAIWALRRFREDTPEVYPAISIALALASYGLASMAHASGLLAVFITALTLGNARALPYRATLVRFHAALAYLAQVLMFFVLGVLVAPADLVEPRTVVGGVMLAFLLAFVARPIVVTLVLLPFGYSAREIAAIAWLGLRGAVPVILMTIPLITAAGSNLMSSMQVMFNAVFFCVLVGSFLPGSTVRWMMRFLRVRLPPAPRPTAALDLVTRSPLDATLAMLIVQPGAPIAGRTVGEAGIPGEVTIAMLIRGTRTERVRGDTRFEIGDEVALSMPEAMLPTMRALFGERVEHH